MADEIEKLLKQAMLKRGEAKAEAAVESLGKLARKKAAIRENVLQALKRVTAESPQTFARFRAFEEIGKTVTADDHEWLKFLRDNLIKGNSEAVEYTILSLLRLFGAGAYPELIDIILDKKRPAFVRMFCIEMLSEHCKRPFDKSITVMDPEKITEDMYPVKALKEWKAAGCPPPKPPVIPTKELKKLGIELPDPYLKFLAKHYSDDEYGTDEGQWRLYAAEELLEKIDVDGTTVPAIQQLTRYAATLNDVMDGDATESDRGKPYPLKRLAAGWAIGTESSGDVLYLDPADKYSVWIFHHDGGDVERVAKSFGGWIRTAEPC